jgi:hypothetical protein
MAGVAVLLFCWWTPEYRELQRSKDSKHSARFFKNMLGVAVLPVCWIHVSFVLQEQLTNLNVTFFRRIMQRSTTSAEYRELQRSKQKKHSARFLKNMLGVAVLPVFLVNARLVQNQVILHKLNIAIFWSIKNIVLAGNPSGCSCLKQKWMGESQRQL